MLLLLADQTVSVSDKKIKLEQFVICETIGRQESFTWSIRWCGGAWCPASPPPSITGSLRFTFSENASLKRLLIRSGQDKFLYGTIVIGFSLEGFHFKSQTSNRITYYGCRPPPKLSVNIKNYYSNSGVGYHLKEIKG